MRMRMRMRTAALLAVALGPLLAAENVDIDAGRRLFQEACSACHGQNGGGGHGPSLVDGRRVRGLSDAQLLESIRKGVPGTEMPPSTLPEAQLQQIASFVRSLSAPAIDAPPAGDPAGGREIFFGKGGCAQCHAILGRGGFLGPDLTEAGSNRTASQLRESLLQPNKRIEPGFAAVTVTLTGGQRIEGVAKNYDNYSIVVLDSAGRLHLLAMADTAKIEWRERSLMPDDFARRLSAEETRDLVAFLSRQTVRAGGKK